MYQFYDDELKPKYNDKIKLVYTDTDTFALYTETDDIYNDFNDIKEQMDFSEYAKTHPNYDETNKKVLGKFKDELNGVLMVEFLALKPKMYCCLDENGKLIKKAKGINKKKVKKNLIWIVIRNH